MKPKKITELVEVEYWSCPVPTHRHGTLAVAEACAAKNRGPRGTIFRGKRVLRRWTENDMADVLEAVVEGATFKELGRKYDVTQERMRQLLWKAQRRAIHPSRLSEPLPDHDDYSVVGMRKHAAFWKRQAAKMRQMEAEEES